MNIDKEVNMKLFQQQQEQSRHLDYEKEFGIYKAIANGNMEEVKARHKEYEEHKGYTTGNDKNGVLSADPLQNAKYHFVILAAMTSRFCAQYGLPREIAYSMSDIFIQRMDVCKKKEEVDKIQTEMIMSYTKAMQDNRGKPATGASLRKHRRIPEYESDVSLPFVQKGNGCVHLRLHQDRAFENCGTSVAI